MFTKRISRGGRYTVGPKGGERRFENYEKALEYLHQASSAHWRRPNSDGNWGIVIGVGWKELP